MDKVIEITNLVKKYPLNKVENGEKEFEAVKGVSFEVYKGEIFGILGPNGAGKTTTLGILEAINKQTSGDVKVLGLNNLTQTKEIKSRIGVQLQESGYLPNLSLSELLDLFTSFYPRGPSSCYKRTALLQLVSLQDKQHEQVKNLSGGQKQRFTIATSLVNNPEILFLDEPTTGLDPKARRDLWQLIKKINAGGITIVLTTHYMEEAEFLCSRVAIMDKGKILEIDEPSKLITRISDTTQVSFFTENKITTDLFKNIPEVKKIYSHYPKVILELCDLEKISLLVNILKTNKIVFSGFTVRTASLEDVYLRLTGKEFENE